jgi:O-antigen/teichoic acid export membrane protein
MGSSEGINGDIKSLVNHAVFNVVCRFLVIGLGLIGSILTARWLGPEGRGIYFTCITIAGIIAQFGTFGLTTSNTYIASKAPSDTWPLLINSILLSVMVFLFLTIAIIVWHTPLSDYFGLTSWLLWCIAILAPSLLLFNLSTCLLIANERYIALNLCAVINAVLVVLGMLVVVFVSPEALFFVAATSLASVISTFSVVVIQRQKNSSFSPDRNLFFKGISISLKAYLVLIMGFVIPRIGVFFLGKSHSSEELGIYSIAVQLFDVIALLPASLAMVLFPRLLKREDNQWSTTKDIFIVSSIFITIIGLSFYAIGQWFVVKLFGGEFINSYAVLLAMLPGAFVYAGMSILSQFVVSQGFPFSLVLVWIVGFSATCLTAFHFIPNHGAIGAAWSQSIGLFTVFVGVVYLAISIKIRNKK